MNVLIDSLFTSTGIQKDSFVSCVEDAQCTVFVSNYVRYRGQFESDIPDNEPLLVYGSIQFVEDALKHFDNAVAFYQPSRFSVSYAMSHLPIQMFVNHDAQFWPVSVLQQQYAMRKHKGMQSTADQKEYFVRSDSGRKLFAGKCIPINQLHCFDRESLSPQSIVAFSTPKSINLEVRCFIYCDQVVSWSVTHQYGEPVTNYKGPEKVIFSMVKFAEEVAQTVDQLDILDTVYVCDVALYLEAGHGMMHTGIMEFNAASTSDLHQCDITAVFKAMTDCIKKENTCN